MKLRRKHTLTGKEEAEGLDPDDRKNTGYLPFYNTMLGILKSMRDNEEEYEAYLKMTQAWIMETRRVVKILPLQEGLTVRG